MVMSKGKKRCNAQAKPQPLNRNWLSNRFFPNRSDVTEDVAVDTEAEALRKSISLKRSRMRIKTAQMQLDALIAAEVATYQSAFDVEDEASAETMPDRKDPSTWKSPNLDKLKASILADWNNDSSEFRGKAGFPATS